MSGREPVVNFDEIREILVNFSEMADRLSDQLSRLFVPPNMSHPRVPLSDPMEILRVVEETVDIIVGASEEVKTAVNDIDDISERMGYGLPEDL